MKTGLAAVVAAFSCEGRVAAGVEQALGGAVQPDECVLEPAAPFVADDLAVAPADEMRQLVHEDEGYKIRRHGRSKEAEAKPDASGRVVVVVLRRRTDSRAGR